MFAAFIVFVSLLAACKKDGVPSESALYGFWVKGNQAGDTLQFLRLKRKDIMRQNESFNAALPAYTEKEYKYQDGKLSLQLFAPFSEDFHSIASFLFLCPPRSLISPTGKYNRPLCWSYHPADNFKIKSYKTGYPYQRRTHHK